MKLSYQDLENFDGPGKKQVGTTLGTQIVCVVANWIGISNPDPIRAALAETLESSDYTSDGTTGTTGPPAFDVECLQCAVQMVPKLWMHFLNRFDGSRDRFTDCLP